MNVPVLVLAAASLMLLLERLAPARQRPAPPGWWLRAGLLNGAQAAVAWLGTVSWDIWFSGSPLWPGADLHGASGVFAGYLLITFVYYWWHRARHANPLLWRFVHRLHHSPSRIEVLTSFYKHPLELVLNGLLSSALLHCVLGLGPVDTASTVLITGLAELFYHWNVRTPRWLGWFFQRPEMHRVHHQRGVHTSNYSDLPLWDALFGTLDNPFHDIDECGFPDEHRLGALLAGAAVQEQDR